MGGISEVFVLGCQVVVTTVSGAGFPLVISKEARGAFPWRAVSPQRYTGTISHLKRPYHVPCNQLTPRNERCSLSEHSAFCEYLVTVETPRWGNLATGVISITSHRSLCKIQEVWFLGRTGWKRSHVRVARQSGLTPPPPTKVHCLELQMITWRIDRAVFLLTKRTCDVRCWYEKSTVSFAWWKCSFF